MLNILVRYEFMGVEKLYTKLPNFLKYNRIIFNFSMKLSTMLSNVNHKSKIIDSQHELMNFIFLNSKFEAKGTLRNTQLLYVELLRFIANVCNKYDINYLIADGTLLGAVRHGGFIPWDDDIDLALLREDYDRLIEVLPKEISKFEFLKSRCGLTLLKDNYQNYFKNFNSVYDVVNGEQTSFSNITLVNTVSGSSCSGLNVNYINSRNGYSDILQESDIHFYGDLCVYSYLNSLEESLQPCYHRLNSRE